MTLTGLYVPLVTPFGSDGQVDTDALAALAYRLLDDGATGLVALGTTGEPDSLTEPERRAVLDAVLRVCRERSAPLVVGANTEARLRELTDRPEVTAALTLVPPFVRPGEAATLAHFDRLASASPVPLIIYHVPYRTGQPLSAATLLRLAELPNIAGVKLATGGIDAETVALLAHVPPGFAVLAGDDLYAAALLALGAPGAILASAHVATAAFAELVRAWRAGDAVRGRTLGHRLSALSAALFAEPNPTVIKAVLYERGELPSARVRPPLLPAGPASTTAALREADHTTAVLREADHTTAELRYVAGALAATPAELGR